MNYGEKAENLFLSGCNCAQAVLVAYCDRTGMTEEQAMMIASGFGGGMGRMREVCGAVSGALMVLGCLYGYREPGQEQLKAAHYAIVQDLAAKFRAQHGTIICRELLGNPDSSPTPTPRTEAFYHHRPCGRFIRTAAELVQAYLEEHPTAAEGTLFSSGGIE